MGIFHVQTGECFRSLGCGILTRTVLLRISVLRGPGGQTPLTTRATQSRACLCGLHWPTDSGKAWEWVLEALHVCGYSEVVAIIACLCKKWPSPAPLSPSKISINPCPFGWCFKISNWITFTHNLITSQTAAFELVPRTSESVYKHLNGISQITHLPRSCGCKSCLFPKPHIFQVSSLWCR